MQPFGCLSRQLFASHQKLNQLLCGTFTAAVASHDCALGRMPGSFPIGPGILFYRGHRAVLLRADAFHVVHDRAA
jgi:hypothetical protein